MEEVISHMNQHIISNDHDPFVGPEIEYIVACTQPQVEMLTACLLGGNDANLAFNESITLKFSGQVNRVALQNAFEQLVLRHESLRCAFGFDNMEVYIFKNIPFQMFYQDNSALNNEQHLVLIEHYIEQESIHVFDLLYGPLFKAGLIKQSEDAYQLVITAHHIVCDGWSIGVILQDLGKLYSAIVQNLTVSLPPSASFQQYALTQNEFFKTNEYQQIENFWLDQYQNDIPVLNLPTTYPRPTIRTYKSTRLDFELDDTLVKSIKTTGTKAGCSFVTTLLSLFEIFLYKLTDQSDIVVGLPASGQSITGNYNLVGHCVNLLPLRSFLSPNICFQDYIIKRREYIFDAYEHQQLTFGSMFTKLKIKRDPSRIPLMPVVFNIDMGMSEGINFNGLQFKLLSNPRAYENFELFLNVSNSQNLVTLEWSYNTQLFSELAIKNMMTGFTNLIKTIVKQPLKNLGEIDYLQSTTEDLNQLEITVESEIKPMTFIPKKDEKAVVSKNKISNNTLSTTNINSTFVNLFEDQVQKHPHNIALIYQNVQLSYLQLNERSNQIAQYLKSRGVVNNSIVPICIERNVAMMIGIIAILKAGGAYVPIDPDYPVERIKYMLADTASTILLTTKAHILRINVEPSIEVIDIEDDTIFIDQPTSNLNISIGQQNLAYVIYTSGSTGKPKGVMIQHGSLVNYLLNPSAKYINEAQQSSGTFIHLSYAFDASITGIFMPLLFGKLVVIGANKNVEIFEDENLLKYAPYDFIKITPAHLSFLKGKMKDKNGQPLTERLVIGGEALKLNQFDYFDNEGINVEIINEYGPTEATVGCTVYAFNPVQDIQKLQHGISIGKPIGNTQIYIVDEHNNLSIKDVVGEICIAGDGLALGYLNLPDLTKKKFILNPFDQITGSKLYKTGDLGRWLADGNIEYVGRIDDQVKLRGYRIELSEIENTLESIEGINQAVVLIKNNNSNDARLVAYIVLDDDNAIKTDNINKAVNDVLGQHNGGDGKGNITAVTDFSFSAMKKYYLKKIKPLLTNNCIIL